MNLKHSVVLIASVIVFIISLSLFSEVFQNAGKFISELLSLYSLGVAVGCGLAATWLIGEFAGQD